MAESFSSSFSLSIKSLVCILSSSLFLLMLNMSSLGFSTFSMCLFALTLFKMGLLRATHGWGRALPKIYHTYAVMMKRDTIIPYLKKIQKILSNSFYFIWVFKDFLINVVTILMMSAKLVTLSLVKIKVFWDKSCEAIIWAHDVTSKVLLCESNYIVDAVMWTRFGKFNIPMTEVIITSILWGLDHKNQLFWAVLLVQVQ